MTDRTYYSLQSIALVTAIFLCLAGLPTTGSTSPSVFGDNTHVVGGANGHPSIASALATAQFGQTVLIMAGDYYEDSLVLPVGVSIESLGDVAIIGNASSAVLTVVDNSRVSGLTIHNVGGTDAVGLRIIGSAVVEHCTLSADWDCIVTSGVDVVIRDCIFEPKYDAILATAGNVDVINCLFVDSWHTQSTPAACIMVGGATVLAHGNIAYLGADGVAHNEWIRFEGSAIIRSTDNFIVGNEGDYGIYASGAGLQSGAQVLSVGDHFDGIVTHVHNNGRVNYYELEGSSDWLLDPDGQTGAQWAATRW